MLSASVAAMPNIVAIVVNVDCVMIGCGITASELVGRCEVAGTRRVLHGDRRSYLHPELMMIVGGVVLRTRVDLHLGHLDLSHLLLVLFTATCCSSCLGVGRMGGVGCLRAAAVLRLLLGVLLKTLR